MDLAESPLVCPFHEPVDSQKERDEVVDEPYEPALYILPYAGLGEDGHSHRQGYRQVKSISGVVASA